MALISEADLRLYFRICRLFVFSLGGSTAVKQLNIKYIAFCLIVCPCIIKDNKSFN